MSSFMKLYLGDPGGPYDPPPGREPDEVSLEDRIHDLEDTMLEVREGLDYARQLRHARSELYIAVVALALLAGFIGGVGAAVLLRGLVRIV